MGKVFFNIAFSCVIGVLWYHFGGGDKAMALVFFLIVFAALFIRPINYQNPATREKYLEQIRKNRDRKVEIEKAKMDEKKRLKEAKFQQEQLNKRLMNKKRQ